MRKKINNLISDEKFSEILTGSVWALAARMLSAGLALVTSIMIARIYGAEMVGILAVIQVFMMFSSMVTVLGTDTSILRLIPEHISKYSTTSAFKVYRKTQYFVGAFSILAGVLFFLASDLIAVKVFTKPHLSFFLALASGFVVFRSLMELNTQAVRGLRLIRAFALMQVFPSAVILIFLIVITVFHGGHNSPVYAHMLAWAVTALVGVWLMNRFFQKLMLPEDMVHPMSLRKILNISTPMLMTSSVQFAIMHTGVILLGVFNSEAEIGCYSVAVKLATLTVFVLQSINAMTAPKFSELYYKGAMDELFYIARKSTRLIFWISVPILLVLLVFGKPMLGILFGREFTAAYPAMAILVVGQFVNSISGSTGYFMDMTGHQKVFRNIMVVTGLINIILSVLLIPRFGIVGAACAAMICLVFWNLYTLLYIKRKYGKSIGYVPFLVG